MGDGQSAIGNGQGRAAAAARVLNMSRVLREPWAMTPRGGDGDGEPGRPVLLMAGALVGAMLARGIVYVGREHARTGLPRSWLGNPYIVGRHGDRKTCIARYRGHLARMIEPSSVKRGWLAQMHADGVSVACWCAPHPCHGSVVLEAAAACAAGDGVAWARAQLAGAAEAVADAVLYGMRAPRPAGGGVDAARGRAITNNGTEAWL